MAHGGRLRVTHLGHRTQSFAGAGKGLSWPADLWPGAVSTYRNLFCRSVSWD